MVEEELAVAGVVALGADAVQAFQQGRQPVEILQTDDVATSHSLVRAVVGMRLDITLFK